MQLEGRDQAEKCKTVVHRVNKGFKERQSNNLDALMREKLL